VLIETLSVLESQGVGGCVCVPSAVRVAEEDVVEEGEAVLLDDCETEAVVLALALRLTRLPVAARDADAAVVMLSCGEPDALTEGVEEDTIDSVAMKLPPLLRVAESTGESDRPAVTVVLGEVVELCKEEEVWEGEGGSVSVGEGEGCALWESNEEAEALPQREMLALAVGSRAVGEVDTEAVLEVLAQTLEVMETDTEALPAGD
jgi:hypothetical protein